MTRYRNLRLIIRKVSWFINKLRNKNNFVIITMSVSLSEPMQIYTQNELGMTEIDYLLTYIYLYERIGGCTMATIADRSRTKEIIERLQMIMDTAPSVPLTTGKVSVYKDEVQSLLTELSSQMEMEIKTYHEVNDRKGKIISEAKKEAEKIIFEAERSASRMRVTKHTTGVAPVDYSMLNDEERSALGGANEIYAASLIYTDEMLTEVTDMIADAYHNIRSDYEIILQVLEEKLNVINNNRAELMEGLQEMDPDDRNQQMLEIGQLLSSELYNSRMKARMNPDEYQDGSIQLSLDLQEEQEEKTRQAEEKAQRAEEALAQMIAERDALAEKVEKLKSDGMKATIAEAKSAASEEKTGLEKPSEKVEVSMEEKTVESDDEEEYEVVYVTEDELEEGEEYEIEYVDELDDEEAASELQEPTVKEKEVEKTETTEEPKEELSEEEKKAKEKEVAEALKELENLDKENERIPLIPHFKKSESVASVPAEKVAEMATAITTEKKYSGLIGRAVQQREQAQMNETVKRVEDDSFIERTKKQDVKKPEKDEDIRTDKNGKEYVQATMVFDDNYEITEF